MAENTVQAIEKTVQTTHAWLKELTQEGRFIDQQQAYSALRAVLHTLRDRLTVDEAVHLGSELPMLIRGFYFEGWKPAAAPNRERSREELINSVRESLRTNAQIDPAHAFRSVLELLERKISSGEMADIRQALPKDALELANV